MGVIIVWLGAHAGAAARDAVDVQIGPALQRFDMRESADTGERLVGERGRLPGLVGGVEQAIGRWRWSAQVSYFDGALDYDGQTQSGATFTSQTDTTLSKILARVLHQLDDAGRLSAGFGIGYGQWQRHIRGRGSVKGLRERYTAAGLSAQARVSLTRSEAAIVDLDLQLVWPLRTQVEIDFSDRYDTRTLRLGQRMAARISLPASWAVGPRSRFVVEPGFEAWGFGRSNTETLYRNSVPVGVVHQPRLDGYGVDLRLTWVQSF